MTDLITVGSKTSTGGVVLSGNGGVKINGQPTALIGDTATCLCGSKSCRGQGPIVKQSSRAANVSGVDLARVGDLVDTGCGSCYLMASSHQVSLGTSTSTPLNIGSGVNIGNGVNINGGAILGSGVNVGTSSLNIESDVNIGTSQQVSSLKINPKNMYWPPYNPLAEEGKREIKLEYTQDVTEIAILSPDEWKEFFINLSHVITGKSTVGGVLTAVDTAKGLGGLGVTAYVKNYNGVDYLILKNYKTHLKTLLAGNRFKASNPQVVNLGLGALNSVKGMVNYVKISAPVELLVGSAVNGAQFLLNDEYTLRDLGVDQARLIVNGIVAAGLALTIGFAFPATIATVVGSGTILAISGFAVYYTDNWTGYSTDFVNFIAEQFE